MIKADINKNANAQQGQRQINWSRSHMPVLRQIQERFGTEKPFKNLAISACLHVTAETANLARTLKTGGARVMLCASNPLSTQDNVAASLVKHDQIPVFAIHNEDTKTYYQHIKAVLEQNPHITLDDGADLVTALHKSSKLHSKQILGSTEETTTGVIRLNAMATSGQLKFPVIAVNDSRTKYMFDNRYGTGQSTIDGILRATNILLAGKVFVVCGYGWCGKGVSLRAKGMGAQVIVTEVNPIRALEARMDGYEVLPITQAIALADIVVTVTGDKQVIDKSHLKNAKDGIIIGNAGHFNVEINLNALKSLSKSKTSVRPNLEQYHLKNGKSIYLIAQGRLLNLASAEGHPAEVMDLSFANQAMAVYFIAKNHAKLENRVYTLPKAVDEEIAYLKLKSMGIKIDKLTAAQKAYLQSWDEGT